MKIRFLFLAFAALLFAGGIYAGGGDTTTMTLQNAIDTALKNNLDILQARKNVKVAQALLGQNQAQLWIPTVTANGTFTYIDPETASKGTYTENTGNQSIAVTNTYQDNYSSSISLTKPIFAGLKYWNAVITQQLNVKLATDKLEDLKKGIELSITTNFYNLFLLHENVQIYTEIDSYLKGVNATAEAEYQRKMISELDYLKAILPYKSNIPLLLKARHSEVLAKASLCDVLNISNYDSVEFVGNFMDLTNFDAEATNEMEYFEMSLSNDISLKTLVFNLESSRLNKQTADLSRLPSVNLGYTFDEDYINSSGDPINTRSWTPGWNIDLQLSMPLDAILPFSSLSKSIEAMDEGIKQLEYSNSEQINTIRESVKSQVQQIEELKETVVSQSDNLDIAKRSLDLEKGLFARGAAVDLDVENAQIAYDQALLAYYQAMQSYIDAVLILEREGGVDFYGKTKGRTL
jgi:outer membrane protein TolC